MAAAPPCVGLVGLGRLGSAMAERLVQVGVSCHVWTRTDAAARAAAIRARCAAATPAHPGPGALHLASSIEAVVERSLCVVTCLTGDEAVLEVAPRVLAAATPRHLLVEMSTVRPRCANPHVVP